MDIFVLRAEDFSENQQRQIYNQYRERSNTRLKRRRRENNEVYANKRVSQFLKRKGYRYFPKNPSQKELNTYLNEMLLYLQDRTSLASGIKEVKSERLARFKSGVEGKYPELIFGESTTAQELDDMLKSDEWEMMKSLYDYELILEDFSNEIERGHSVDEILEEWKKLLDSTTMEYADYRKMINERAALINGKN